MLPAIIHRDSWDEILLRPVEDGSGFICQKTYRLQFQLGDTDFFFQVPKGFHTDLASIPSLGRLIFKTWGRYTAACIVHDCFYAYRAGSRELADDIFEVMMREDGVGEEDITYLAEAVRWFGHLAWEHDDELPDIEVISEDGYWINP